ncbi:MAG: DUF364 domain-containing protein [Spirochaetaceae bacterium]|nr:MAG: DUF364 domain-containing protein [Spirochaetaceae bacterium]
MGIAETIIQIMKSKADQFTLKRVQVGLIYSAVELNNLATGVAYTFPKGEHCGMGGRSKPLAGRTASEIITFLAGRNLVLSSLALATVNALLATNPLPQGAERGDALEKIGIRKGDRVCMVGCFFPIMETLRKKEITVTAVDEIPKPGSGLPEEVENVLPNSQVAIFTATSIINNTLDHLLQLAHACREVALLGPSTPLLKESFTDTPITCLSGVRIMESEKVLQIISEGGGFKDFKRYCRKVNIRLIDN